MSTKEKVMEELLNSDDYISGETLAQKTGCRKKFGMESG